MLERKPNFLVMPVKTGIQELAIELDSGFRRNDVGRGFRSDIK